jgi:nucleotide-binding universal stress UspA family protein
MYTKIVVGTDDSRTAREAVRQAADLAEAFSASLHIVTAYSVLHEGLLAAVPASTGLMGTPEVTEASDAQREQCEDLLRDVVNQLAGRGVKAEGHAVAGDPASAILEVAERQHADLIVVGSRGMTGAKRFLLGSVPNKVSHRAACNVLIVCTDRD